MSKLFIKTTQNIPLFFTPASMVERMVAFMMDTAISLGYLIFVFWVLKVSEWVDFSDNWSSAAYYILWIFPAFFYRLVAESLMQGQTIGKRIMKIRVIKIDGYQASFFDFAIRWLFSILEIYSLSFISILSVLFSKYSQRLGDFASGTAVITEKNKIQLSHSVLMEVQDQYEPYFTRSQVLAFSDKDIRTIKEYFTQARSQHDYVIIGKIAHKIEQVSHRKNDMIPMEFVETFLKDYNYYTTQ